MEKREKRLKKGIASIEKAIEKHETKMEEAKKEGRIELSNYFEKEIESLKKRKENRENKLNR